ncbi:MAG: hypothetical protein DIU80_012820 [Chloroflexota bacterium]|nr:MAG: hypothetical protein DIU80_19725 [Chloroflexota bacterium]
MHDRRDEAYALCAAIGQQLEFALYQLYERPAIVGDPERLEQCLDMLEADIATLMRRLRARLAARPAVPEARQCHGALPCATLAKRTGSP